MSILYLKVFIKIRALNKLCSNHQPINKLINESTQMIDTKAFDQAEIKRLVDYDISTSKLEPNSNQRKSFRKDHSNPTDEFKEVKITKLLIIIMACFVLCWFPFFTVSLFYFQCLEN